MRSSHWFWAFTVVSTAFQILSDADKRAHFDRYGSDPDDRRAASQPQFARRQHSGFQGEEMSPEDLFNMFFGGGAARGGFQFGGPGVRTYSFGGGQQQARRATPGQAGQQQGNDTPALIQLLPLLVLFAFFLLTQLPSLFMPSPPPDPSFSFEPTALHTLHRQTNNLKADYYLNPNDFRHSQVYKDLLSSNPAQADGFWAKLQQTTTWKDVSLPRTVTEFEGRVENGLIHNLRVRCENENDIQWRKIQRACVSDLARI
jgi:DnaJ family protein B protein 12